MDYPIYVFFGLAPSIIWLLFYLRKDVHPESNRMVLKIFFFGMIAAIPAVLLELGFAESIKSFNLSPTIFSLLYVFIGIALTEEVLKYLVVRGEVLKNSEFDEPVDTMLYMIIAALGFAASENLLILFSLETPFQFYETFLVSSFRFVGATFLHTLCSGLIGYFLAISFFETKKRFRLKVLGITTAVVLHGFYNFSIMKIEGTAKFVIPAATIIILAIFITIAFKKLKKLSSVCKIK